MCISYTRWAIWAARWKAIQDGIFQSPQATHCFINIFIDELEMIKEVPTSMTERWPSILVATAQRPKVPPMGYAKIHVDVGVQKGVGGTGNNSV